MKVLVAEDNEESRYLLVKILQAYGHEVTRELRGLPEFKETPIIALTAYAMKGDQEKILEVGCNGYIPKPIVPEEFIQVVDSYLRGCLKM